MWRFFPPSPLPLVHWTVCAVADRVFPPPETVCGFGVEGKKNGQVFPFNCRILHRVLTAGWLWGGNRALHSWTKLKCEEALFCAGGTVEWVDCCFFVILLKGWFFLWFSSQAIFNRKIEMCNIKVSIKVPPIYGTHKTKRWSLYVSLLFSLIYIVLGEKNVAAKLFVRAEIGERKFRRTGKCNWQCNCVKFPRGVSRWSHAQWENVLIEVQVSIVLRDLDGE